jgi:hypothetical protein
MITLEHKIGNDWIKDEKQFHSLDQAKAHSVSSGYGQYKVWNDTTLLAHLFNQVVAKPKITKKKSVEPKVEVEVEPVELDTPEQEQEWKKA